MEETLNITSINLLIRFNKTQKIFLKAAATSATVEKANFKERVP